VILLLLLDTGMRIGELLGLKVSDVHERFVKVFGKGRREREIGVHPEVSKLLWKYIHKHRRPVDQEEQVLFLSKGGKPLTFIGVQNLIKRIQHRSGLDGIKFTPHVFRHTFAKMYLDQGGDLFKLSRELGHSGVEITKKYLEDFSSSEARKDHTAFSPIANVTLKKSGKSRKKQK
jgi:integrase/recombinase XerD